MLTAIEMVTALSRVVIAFRMHPIALTQSRRELVPCWQTISLLKASWNCTLANEVSRTSLIRVGHGSSRAAVELTWPDLCPPDPFSRLSPRSIPLRSLSLCLRAGQPTQGLPTVDLFLCSLPKWKFFCNVKGENVFYFYLFMKFGGL